MERRAWTSATCTATSCCARPSQPIPRRAYIHNPHAALPAVRGSSVYSVVRMVGGQAQRRHNIWLGFHCNERFRLLFSSVIMLGNCVCERTGGSGSSQAYRRPAMPVECPGGCITWYTGARTYRAGIALAYIQCNHMRMATHSMGD